MAGEGRRFKEAGFKKPKPFIDVAGKTMIERVLDNLKIDDARFILIARDDHLEKKKDLINLIKKRHNCRFLKIAKLTEGAACSVLLAKDFINNDNPIFIANSDQIIDMNPLEFIEDSKRRALDGCILTFYSDHPKWSYAKVDDKNLVTMIKEKEVISPYATVGIYYFKKGRDFVNSAEEMIANNDRVNNEFYVAPVYNYFIKKGAKTGVYNIKESQMHGLGTPEDLELYLEHLKI